jgi:YD repeat-containing protein
LSKIDFTYNYLNLPATAKSATGTAVNLAYTYDAAGNKLARNSSGTVKNYISGIDYKPDGTTIDIIHTEEGIARNIPGGNYSYEYNLSDHLGNVRVTFKQSPIAPYSLEVIQRDDYLLLVYIFTVFMNSAMPRLLRFWFKKSRVSKFECKPVSLQW